jgi:adenine phosphoribosyltransferase
MTATSNTSAGNLAARLRRAIRDVPDFPKAGIVFKDITPVLEDAELFRLTTEGMGAFFAHEQISHVIAVESRGFILGAPVAQRLGAGFIPVRKPGKLPARIESESYALEYGTDTLEVHADACDWSRGPRVLIVDDVLATGGTADAARRLIERLGGVVVGFSFLIALSFLPGLDRLRGRSVHSLITY